MAATAASPLRVAPPPPPVVLVYATDEDDDDASGHGTGAGAGHQGAGAGADPARRGAREGDDEAFELRQRGHGTERARTMSHVAATRARARVSSPVVFRTLQQPAQQPQPEQPRPQPTAPPQTQPRPATPAAAEAVTLAPESPPSPDTEDANVAKPTRARLQRRSEQAPALGRNADTARRLARLDRLKERRRRQGLDAPVDSLHGHDDDDEDEGDGEGEGEGDGSAAARPVQGRRQPSAKTHPGPGRDVDNDERDSDRDFIVEVGSHRSESGSESDDADNGRLRHGLAQPRPGAMVRLMADDMSPRRPLPPAGSAPRRGILRAPRPQLSAQDTDEDDDDLPAAQPWSTNVPPPRWPAASAVAAASVPDAPVDQTPTTRRRLRRAADLPPHKRARTPSSSRPPSSSPSNDGDDDDDSDDDVPSPVPRTRRGTPAPRRRLTPATSRHSAPPGARATTSASPSPHAARRLSGVELPEGFNFESADAFETAFERYVQYLVSAALDDDFISSVLEEGDPYFVPAVQRIDADVRVRKESVASNAWDANFRRAIEARPFVKTSLGQSDRSPCDACHRTHNVSTVIMRLYGPTYDSDTFRVRVAHDDPEDDLTYLLGRHCAVRASMYHRLHHCRRALYELIAREARELRRVHDDATTVRTIIDNEAWMAQLLRDYRRQMDEAVALLTSPSAVA